MKPIVMVRMYGGKEFFVVDEDTTTDELLEALLKMKNGERIAMGFLKKEWYHMKRLEHCPHIKPCLICSRQRTEVDYSAQSP